jgi:hypothetical protein
MVHEYRYQPTLYREFYSDGFILYILISLDSTVTYEALNKLCAILGHHLSA